MQGKVFEREALYALPALLASLLDLDASDVRVEASQYDHDFDAVVQTIDRTWLAEVKASASPGVVVAVAERLRSRTHRRDEGLLVVEHMSKAGAAAATEHGLNWVDLSGNGRLRAQGLHVWVQGRPRRVGQPGRPSTPFAPKSARVTRFLLEDPSRWWRQTDLVEATGLDDGHLSRVVRRLDEDRLLARDGTRFRPRDPDVLLDAWADVYRFDRHDILAGHVSGSGMELASELQRRLTSCEINHAFTGLSAAWTMNQHARFRLVSVYVHGDPRAAASAIGVRDETKGANVQIIGPDDVGIFHGAEARAGFACVNPVQVYLDLLHLPERAKEAAIQLREDRLLWGVHD